MNVLFMKKKEDVKEVHTMTRKAVKKEPAKPVVHTPFKVQYPPVTLNTHCWEGCSACLIDADGNTVVITCPDVKQLEIFWSRLTDDKLNHELIKHTIGEYPKINEAVKIKEEMSEWFWILDNKHDKCFIWTGKGNRERNWHTLGKAVRKTAVECKILLRKLGWDREDIEEIEIEDIPF